MAQLANVLKYDTLCLSSIVDSSTTTRSNEQVFRNVIGNIVSPNYPRNYGNNENKRYKIAVPSRREIVLIFNDFDIQHDENCARDFLKASTLYHEYLQHFY